MKRAWSILFVLGTCISSMAAHATYIDSAGRLWRELTDTVGYSYDAINSGGVNGCNAATGACSGLLGGAGPSVDGWTWATEPEVRALFRELGIPGFNPLPPGPFNYGEFNSTWAPAIILGDPVFGADDGIFEATFDTGPPPVPVLIPGSGILGLTRTTILAGGLSGVLRPQIRDVYFLIGADDTADTLRVVGTDEASSVAGIWMFRPSTPVALPSVAWLALIGLCALVFSRRLTTSGSRAA